MTAYYNEIDPYAAQWLRNLIKAGHIAPGDVDERSIVDVRADDLSAYTQCHFFSGIGGWSIALRQAGWPDDRPVWTGSCPCQPFSAAGAGKAADDERHLWPAWFSLIAERHPAIVFGEQVEAAVGWGWLDLVFSDLEGAGYACGASVQPACSVGAPHIRQRLWFVADAADDRYERSGSTRRWRRGYADSSELGKAQGLDGRLSERQDRQTHSEFIGPGEAFVLGNPDEPGSQGQRIDRNGTDECAARPAGVAGSVVNAAGEQVGLPGRTRLARTTLNGFWHDAEWIACTDGKARPVGPGSFPLGHGIQRRASKLRAYGNAIVPQVAAEFIRAATSPITAA